MFLKCICCDKTIKISSTDTYDICLPRLCRNKIVKINKGKNEKGIGELTQLEKATLSLLTEGISYHTLHSDVLSSYIASNGTMNEKLTG